MFLISMDESHYHLQGDIIKPLECCLVPHDLYAIFGVENTFKDQFFWWICKMALFRLKSALAQSY